MYTLGIDQRTVKHVYAYLGKSLFKSQCFKWFCSKALIWAQGKSPYMPGSYSCIITGQKQRTVF